jgi:hypothetical protein
MAHIRKYIVFRVEYFKRDLNSKWSVVTICFQGHENIKIRVVMQGLIRYAYPVLFLVK